MDYDPNSTPGWQPQPPDAAPAPQDTAAAAPQQQAYTGPGQPDASGGPVGAPADPGPDAGGQAYGAPPPKMKHAVTMRAGSFGGNGQGGPPRSGGNTSRAVLIVVALVLAVALFVVASSIGQLGQSINSLFTTTGYNNTPPANSFAVVTVLGTIQSSSSNQLGINEPSYHHSATVSYIKQLAENDDNKGILLYLNTPGGSVLESDEVYLALQAYKEATGRPVWAFMYSNCASGGYYIASAATHLVAERNTITGSIGVYISMTDTSKLYEEIGIETVLIRSGDQKGTGISGVPITDDQRAVYQSIVDEMYGQFVEVVADGRGMSEAEVRSLADGRVYTARQAVENGLIDTLGTWDEVLEEFTELTGATPSYPNFSRSSTVGTLLSGYAEATPKNETETQLDMAEKYPNGVPMMLYDLSL